MIDALYIGTTLNNDRFEKTAPNGNYVRQPDSLRVLTEYLQKQKQ